MKRNKSTSKARHKADSRRAIRRQEKNSRVIHDKMIGNCARRNYGQGLATV